jgi:7-cyano-7-deazaguanine synthase
MKVQYEGDRNAIVLTSGGPDSVTLLYYVAKVLNPKHVVAIHADYGQRMMEMERLGVLKNVEHLRNLGYNIETKLIDIRWLGSLSTSKLVREVEIPETPTHKLSDPQAASERILWWWDVVRNLQLITIGLAHAESYDLRNYIEERNRKIYDVYIGIRRETPVTMKDNTPEFIEEMNRVAEVSTHFGGYKVYAPFINLDKDAIIRLGHYLGVKFEFTFSCYTDTKIWEVHPVVKEKVLLHCGYCSNCKRRAIAFAKAGVPDPTLYLRNPNIQGVEYEKREKYWIGSKALKKE